MGFKKWTPSHNGAFEAVSTYWDRYVNGGKYDDVTGNYIPSWKIKGYSELKEGVWGYGNVFN